MMMTRRRIVMRAIASMRTMKMMKMKVRWMRKTMNGTQRLKVSPAITIIPVTSAQNGLQRG
jgi:hypothetical protein